jgi:hypothetical protein
MNLGTIVNCLPVQGLWRYQKTGYYNLLSACSGSCGFSRKQGTIVNSLPVQGPVDLSGNRVLLLIVCLYRFLWSYQERGYYI